MYSATYSPDDNKLRLYAATRLDADTYARVKAAGFRWAPKQDLFVAPAWTPAREDLLLELAGEIGDEDTSLMDRAEERAERFDGYQVNRAQDAESARAAVSRIADNIPFGQPILVGHHSEKHARKDAERIENGMRKAVKMWKTAEYWTGRAHGAIRHAKYKERPDVRARRIKKLEAEVRKVERSKADAEKAIRIWSNVHEDDSIRRKSGEPMTFLERVTFLAGHTNTAPFGVYMDLVSDPPKITPDEAWARTLAAARSTLAHCARWLEHLAFRLTYERAMLADAGGTLADQTGPEKGGAVRCWASPRGGWSYIQKVNKVTVTVLDNWGNGGKNFTRTMPFDKLAGIMTAADVQRARDEERLTESEDRTGFYLADAPPAIPPKSFAPEDNVFKQMAESLRAGVQMVSAPQLFPTPRDLAQRMVDLAEIQPGHRVLEPSAGTGNLLGAMGGRMFGHNPERGAVVAVELNRDLATSLRRGFPLTSVFAVDFLAFDGLEPFDRVVMNPPFENGADIKHIRHALELLVPGGRLVALCANGPRQVAALQPIADSWEELPPGTFDGTGVHAVLATFIGRAPGHAADSPEQGELTGIGQKPRRAPPQGSTSPSRRDLGQHQLDPPRRAGPLFGYPFQGEERTLVVHN